MAVREGSYVEEDTQEDFPTEEVIEGMNRELDLRRAEVTGKVWSARMVLQEEVTQASECAGRGETISKLPGRSFPQSHSWARGHKSFVCNGSVDGPPCFVL